MGLREIKTNSAQLELELGLSSTELTSVYLIYPYLHMITIIYIFVVVNLSFILVYLY